DPARPRGLVAALERIADAAGREEHRHGEPVGIDAVAGDLSPLAAYGVVGRAAADDRATIADDAPQPFDDLFLMPRRLKDPYQLRQLPGAVGVDEGGAEQGLRRSGRIVAERRGRGAVVSVRVVDQ